VQLLGFPNDGEQIGGVTSANLSVTSPQQAVLNNLQLILVKCNITSGSYLNSNMNNIVCGPKQRKSILADTKGVHQRDKKSYFC